MTSVDPVLLSEYFSDFESLLASEDNFDVKIQIGSEPDTKDIHAHSSILRARCSYFKTALSTASKQNGHLIIKKPNVSELLITTILKFLYTCKIEFDDYTGIDVLKLLIVADELDLESLYKYTMKYFINNKKDYIKDNPIKILQLIYSNSKFDELKNICLKEICSNCEKLFKSTEYDSLEKSILLEILKRDDFVVDEIEIWENILKWGLAKHPGVNNKADCWSIQNFAHLGSTLEAFIYLIRFKDISNRDFFNKVVPYQMLFPKELWLKLLNYYIVPEDRASLSLLPSRTSKIQQFIINQKITLLFASWIDKKNPTYTSFNDVKYKFKLLYRSSRDGLNATVFHQKCDEINKTLVIAKIRSTEQIIGGYNPLSWSGSQYKSTNESFIFHISNRNDANSTKYHSYVISNNQSGIYCTPSYLPTFGNGHDIHFTGNNTVNCTPTAYNTINIANGSAFEELEVYQLIKY